MLWALIGLVAYEIATLAVIAAIGHKAPDDFYLLVFLLGVLAYRSYQQRTAEKDLETKNESLPSDRAEAVQRVHNISSTARFVLDVILMISLLIIAFR